MVPLEWLNDNSETKGKQFEGTCPTLTMVNILRECLEQDRWRVAPSPMSNRDPSSTPRQMADLAAAAAAEPQPTFIFDSRNHDVLMSKERPLCLEDYIHLGQTCHPQV